jgi:quercetin dioxygenase-like cupin family protein
MSAQGVPSVKRRFVALVLGAGVLVVGTRIGLAQLPGTRIPGGCDVPVTQRTSDTGCYLTATLPLPRLPGVPVYWHVYSYPSRAAADAVGQRPASIVVESLGTTWLFAIGDAEWQASAGHRVARIGPLPVRPATHYTARFMEAVFPAGQGLQTAVHHHSGPEAWYVVSGAQCLRTPDATKVLREGESGFVEAGPPMMLTSLGPATRRSLLLVLHDSEQPWMTVTTDWRPTVSCPES